MTTAFILLAAMALPSLLSFPIRTASVKKTLPDKSKNSPCIMKASETQNK